MSKKIKIEIELPESPEGYEYTGEYREGEFVLRKKFPRILWVLMHKDDKCLLDGVYDSYKEAAHERECYTFPEQWEIVGFVSRDFK